MVAKLALPVPTWVISEMLGVPYEDHEFFQHHANVGLARYATAEAGQKGAMLGDAIDAGLADSVNDNDAKFPPEFRLSKSNRKKKD